MDKRKVTLNLIGMAIRTRWISGMIGAALMATGMGLSPVEGQVVTRPLLDRMEEMERILSEEEIAAVRVLVIGAYFAGINDAVVDTQVDGTFEGWDGDTLLKLTNGMRIEQTEYHYEYDYAYRPDVLLFASGMFGYEAWIEDTDEPIDVDVIGGGGRLFAMRSLLLELSEEDRSDVMSILFGYFGM